MSGVSAGNPNRTCFSSCSATTRIYTRVRKRKSVGRGLRGLKLKNAPLERHPDAVRLERFNIALHGEGMQRAGRVCARTLALALARMRVSIDVPPLDKRHIQSSTFNSRRTDTPFFTLTSIGRYLVETMAVALRNRDGRHQRLPYFL